MGKRLVLALAAILLSGTAQASERFSLRYPGWTLYLDLHEPRLVHDPLSSSRTLRLLVPGKSLLSESGLRVPLDESMFLSIEATVIQWQADPALPDTMRRAFRAGIGVGMEF